MDVLEHIPEKEREKVLREMIRVVGINKGNHGDSGNKGNRGDEYCRGKARLAPTLILGFPCGEGAEKLSKKMLKWFEKRGSGTARWFEEHAKFGLPDESNMSNWTNRTYPTYGNENLLICEWLLKLEENPHFLKLERFLFSHFRPLVEFFLRRFSFGKCYRKILVIST